MHNRIVSLEYARSMRLTPLIIAVADEEDAKSVASAMFGADFKITRYTPSTTRLRNWLEESREPGTGCHALIINYKRVTVGFNFGDGFMHITDKVNTVASPKELLQLEARVNRCVPKDQGVGIPAAASGNIIVAVHKGARDRTELAAKLAPMIRDRVIFTSVHESPKAAFVSSMRRAKLYKSTKSVIFVDAEDITNTELSGCTLVFSESFYS